MRPAGVNRIQISYSGSGRFFQAATQNVGKADDRIHRIADFVTHVRQKVALRLIGVVCFFFGKSQIDLVLFQQCHIIQGHHDSANPAFRAKQR